jgi:hypothetical protein
VSVNVNRQHKASVFSLLFSEIDAARELYGALEGKVIPPEVPIVINTLDNVLFMEQINDLSFTVGDKVVLLVEHQSSINPNMALRLLLYIGRVYEKIIDESKLYSSTKLEIPRGEFYVLYNGSDPYQDESILSLSDLYADKVEKPALDLSVKIYNIKYAALLFR